MSVSLVSFLLVVGFYRCRSYEISPKQFSYLQDYGYLPPQDPEYGALQTQESAKTAVSKFQRFSGIPVTGLVDDATIRMFSLPRCGVKDFANSDGGRKRRYTIKGLKWQRKALTYKIENWSKDLSKISIARTIRKALSKWEAVSNLRFHQVNTKADIMIKFVRNQHGDGHKFDGPGGIIAHAFFPGTDELAGDTHYDDDETFSLHSDRGRNFYWVSLHEFGHALGLDHTYVKDAVMFPFYKGNGEEMGLHEDDIKGIQFLYGKPTYNPRIIPNNKPRPEFNGNCLGTVRTISQNRILKEIFVVNGDQLYTYDSKNLKRKKGPVPLTAYYKGPDDIDTAYDLPNGNTIFLKGDSSWEYKGRRLIRRDVELTRRGFTSDIYDVDSAFYWSKAKKVYIFKDAVYWRYDPWQRRVDKGYPKAIKDYWIGVPDNIDSVFEWNEKVFFFKGGQYYRFNENKNEVSSGYPLPIDTFFMCDRSPKASRLVSDNKLNAERHTVSSSKTLCLTWFLLSLPYMVMFIL